MNIIHKVVIALPIVLFSSPSMASEIKEPLFCTVQEIESINVATNGVDSTTIDKTVPENVIKAIYRPVDKDRIIESYGIDLDIERKTEFEKSYSTNGGTQYVGVSQPSTVITFFGKPDKKHYLLKKFIRMPKNDGGVLRGFRMDSFTNITLMCIDKSDLKNSH